MAKADRQEATIYRVWCPAVGQTNTKGFSELGAVDAANAARIHAERMSFAAWGEIERRTKRGEHPTVTILVYLPEGAGRTESFVVRRRMEPVYEVIA